MASRGGKTAPRLLEDLLTYDPRYEEVAGRNILTDPPRFVDNEKTGRGPAAVPSQNCRHIFMLKHLQSKLPAANAELLDSSYKIASCCHQCRWHMELTVDFHGDGSKKMPCGKGLQYMLHHFLFDGQKGECRDAFGNPNVARQFRFHCSAPNCPVHACIRWEPPKLSDSDIDLLTNRILLRKRLEAAKGADARERPNEAVSRPADALNYLSAYLDDALNPKEGKNRIPILNRKFMKTFGADLDALFVRLGFVKAEEDDGVSSGRRDCLEDVRHELASLAANIPAGEKTGTTRILQPQPSLTCLKTVLGCLDYQTNPKSRPLLRNAEEEDHPAYAGLGALRDFSDPLILFSFSRQAEVDQENAPYYFECLKEIAIGRESDSDMLSEQVQLLASQGLSTRQELLKAKEEAKRAYHYFTIDPGHALAITDDIIIGKFKARLEDTPQDQEQEARDMLRVIGKDRGSDKIMQAASNELETYSQALSWLDVNEDTPDDFIATMFAVKTGDNPANEGIAMRAVQIIAEARKSARLFQFLNTRNMDAAEMDLGEAYAILGIQDRTAALDLSVLQFQVQSFVGTNPENAEQYDKAFKIVVKDQKVTHGLNPTFKAVSPKKRHPLDSWPVGCQNIGNTCYLNSVLQFLFTIKPLREMVLRFEDYVQDTSAEALETKRVGRSTVSAAKVKRAQEFVFELRKLFKSMIEAPEEYVRPPTRLACLALLKSDDTVHAITENAADQSLGQIGGMPVMGPMPRPDVSASQGAGESAGLQDVTMGDIEVEKRSDTSSTIALADPDEGDKFFEDVGAGSTAEGFEVVERPQPPSRPPPVPPRPQNQAKPATDLRAVEDVAQQQDAAEILNNVFDLLSCAMKGEGTLGDGEQLDLIKKLFFSDVCTVRQSNGSTSSNNALQDHQLVWPGDRDRHLYAAMDEEFGRQALDSASKIEADTSGDARPEATTKYEFFKEASPILIINVRRLVFEDGRSKKIEHHVGLSDTLYLDRYLQRTKSLSEAQLSELRNRQWELIDQLKSLAHDKSELTKTDEQMTMAETLDAASEYIDNLGADKEEDYVIVDPSFRDLSESLRQGARLIERKVEVLSQRMKAIEGQVDAIFADCKDHPYRLHSVFIHRGTATGGHYWIYIHDFQNNIWRKYNDETVDAVEDVNEIFTQEEKYPATSTGIVYVREDLVASYTEAVCRKPTQVDIEMKDVETSGFEDVQIINGVAKNHRSRVPTHGRYWDKVRKKHQIAKGDSLRRRLHSTVSALYHGPS